MVELLTAEGYVATSHPCLFTKQDGTDISIIVAVHVDDLLMLSTNDDEISKLDAKLVVARWERMNGNKLSRQTSTTIKYLSMVMQE